MAEENANTTHSEALAMLESFASVGATRFDLTITTTAGVKDRFWRSVNCEDLKRSLPQQLDAATRLQRNVIVRPYGSGVSFIQLDDLKADKLPALAPAVFLVLETSPGNFQAWVALQHMIDPAFGRRLRKGAGADPTASGATRIAGSFNFKDRYAPAFPLVRIHLTQPARFTTERQLDKLGVLAPPKSVPGTRTSPSLPVDDRDRGDGRVMTLSRRRAPERKFPRRDPAQPRRFRLVYDCDHLGLATRGNCARLIEESSKARVNGTAYALTLRPHRGSGAGMSVKAGRASRHNAPVRATDYGRR